MKRVIVYCYNNDIARIVHDTLAEFGYKKRNNVEDILGYSSVACITTHSTGDIMLRGTIRDPMSDELVIDLKDVADKLLYQPTELEL